MKNNLSEAMLTDLKDRCPNIRELEVIENHFTQIPLKVFPPKLKVLRLKSCYIPGGWFSSCDQYLPQLEVLDLSDCKKTSDSDMKAISHCKALKVLKVDGCYRIGPSGLESIALSLSGLKQLHMSGVNCSDLALHHICRNLKLLTNLNLSGAKESKRVNISPGALTGSITILSELQWLHLGYSNLTDETLSALSVLKKLNWLCISYTNTTKKGIENYRNNTIFRGGSEDLVVRADHVEEKSEVSSLDSTLDYQ